MLTHVFIIIRAFCLGLTLCILLSFLRCSLFAVCILDFSCFGVSCFIVLRWMFGVGKCCPCVVTCGFDVLFSGFVFSQ